MDQPPGFILEGESSKVCRLKKALYGLKQSPRAWFERLSRTMFGLGYIQAHSDHTIFVKRAEKVCVLIVYVDDIIVTGDVVDEINRLKDNLKRSFEIKDLGKLRYFLGIEVSYSKKGIFMCQRKYCLDLLKETGLLGCKTVANPIEPNNKLWDRTTRPLEDPIVYKRLIGKLLYLTITRLDIAYAVSVLSQFL
jgi:Reverse transcriptase (RNA-dependent DNA polymerase)